MACRITLPWWLKCWVYPHLTDSSAGVVGRVDAAARFTEPHFLSVFDPFSTPRISIRTYGSATISTVFTVQL